MTRPSHSTPPAPAERAAIEQARAWGREGVSALPRLLEALATPSWVVRREVVQQLAGLGPVAAAAMCEQLRTQRKGESRLAALVDALVASSDEAEPLILSLLDAENVAVVADGLQILGRRRAKRATPRVVELTRHPDDNVAVASVEALGQIGGPEALACLLEIVESPSFFRSFPAIDALGRLGDTRAVEPLCALLDDALRGPEAARALGRLGDESAIAPLAELLLSGPLSTSRVVAVAVADIRERSQRRYGTSAVFERAFSSYLGLETLEARLERALNGADPTEQRAIGVLLGFFPSSASVESLLPLLDQNPEVAEAAAQSLARLARLGNPQIFEVLDAASSEQRLLLIPRLAGAGAAVPALARCLNDPDSRVRILACDALAKTGDPSCAEGLFELLGDPDIAVSQAATGALQALGSQRVEELALAAATGTPKNRRLSALRIVGHFGSARGAEVLLAAARQPDERVREIALAGLSSIGGDSAREALLAASQHESARTRAAAIRGLGHLDPTPQTSRRLREASQDPDAWVRYYACQALGVAGDEEATELLAARAQDGAGQVRVAAIDALSRLESAQAREVLVRAARDPDAELQRAALSGIGVRADPSLVPLLLDASYAAETATRLVAVSSLAKFSELSALGRVCEVARRDPEPALQHAAIELLSENVAPQATATLIALLAEEAHRSRVVSALSRRGLERTTALSAALGDASADVAEALVMVIVQLPRETAEPLLQAALDQAGDHARRAVARALRFAFDSESTQRALARAASRDADPEVRRIAALRPS